MWLDVHSAAQTSQDAAQTLAAAVARCRAEPSRSDGFSRAQGLMAGNRRGGGTARSRRKRTERTNGVL